MLIEAESWLTPSSPTSLPGNSLHVFNLVLFSSPFRLGYRGLLCPWSFSRILWMPSLSPSFHFWTPLSIFPPNHSFAHGACAFRLLKLSLFQSPFLISGIPNGYFSVLNFLDFLNFLEQLTTPSVLTYSFPSLQCHKPFLPNYLLAPWTNTASVLFAGFSYSAYSWSTGPSPSYHSIHAPWKDLLYFMVLLAT